MKKLRLLGSVLSIFFMAMIILISCDSTNEITPNNEVPKEILTKLEAANFNIDDVYATTFFGERGFVVERDIFLTPAAIDELSIGRNKIPNTEQYHTTNLVKKLPRTITVSVHPDLGSIGSNALNDAISMYNSQNLTLQLQRIAYGGRGKKNKANIVVDAFYELESGGFITLGRAAGFPTRKGDPAKGFGINTRWFELLNPSRAEVAGTMAHEIGHCIGLRHTDYQTRESCGQNINEGSAGIGAHHVPGTPTASDSNSLMQSCGPSNTFNNNDKTALDYLY